MDKLEIKVSSSFVKRNLKLVNDKGAGEAKLFIGSMQKEKEIDDFFNNFSADNNYYFEKNNLLDYLKYMKIEYLAQKCNEYKEIDEKYYQQKFNEVSSNDERIAFSIEPFKDTHRFYIRGLGDTKETFEKFTRELALPKISKIIVEKTNNNFLFLLTLDFEEIIKREVVQTSNDKILNIIEFLNKLIEKYNKHDDIEELKQKLEKATSTFYDKFSIEKLQLLKEEELENRIFGGKVHDSLIYNLINNPEYRIFAGIGTANPYTHADLNPKKFLKDLIEIDGFINNSIIDSEEAFKELIDLINSKSNIYMDRLWFKKLMHIYYPNVFPSQIKFEEQKKILLDLAIIPESIYQSYYYLSSIVREMEIPSEFLYFLNNITDTLDELETNIPIGEFIRKTEGENVLFYGVPGSGKSHTIETQYGLERMTRVVFHPDYMSTDFVGQILPTVKQEEGSDDKLITYEFTPGPFTNVMEKAYKDPGNMYYLVIEEINRGNAPAIFGEIFQLLDRNENGSSKYAVVNYPVARAMYGNEEQPIRIPSNLTILATMNTSDQNVFTLDTAFQRRWTMRMIINDIEKADHKDVKICDTDVSWKIFNQVINDRILNSNATLLSSEDKRLGAYFVTKSDLEKEKDVENRFSEKVIKYLWDDAFKFSRDKLFESSFRSLEQVIQYFISHEGNERFNIFNSEVRTLIFDKVKEQTSTLNNEIDSTNPLEEEEKLDE